TAQFVVSRQKLVNVPGKHSKMCSYEAKVWHVRIRFCHSVVRCISPLFLELRWHLKRPSVVLDFHRTLSDQGTSLDAHEFLSVGKSFQQLTEPAGSVRL